MIMTRTEHSCHLSGRLFLTFALLCSVSGVPVVRARADGEPSLVFYLFEQFVSVPGVNATNIISSPPDGNIQALEWGNLALSEMPVRASNDSSAPLIGNSPAFFFPNKRPRNGSILKLITLDTRQYKGTLFTICDFTSLNDFESENEFAVSGGTGSFRDVSGYITVTLVDKGEDHKTYKYQVYLSTCKRTPLMFR